MEVRPVFSPDGRWIAYGSTESGNFDVYVRPVEGRGKWQISSGGGGWPIWSPDGKELFYWAGSALDVVDVEADADTFRASRPRVQFQGQFVDVGIANPADITPDGQRFVAFRSDVTQSPSAHEHLHVVLNWFEELERTFAGGR